MIKYFIFSFFVLSFLVGKSQTHFGNEWINFEQKYLKISIVKEGMYRLSYQDLLSSDVSFLQTNPQNWQMFYRGKEMSIRLVGEQDGVFDEKDFVEFYAEGNNGEQDSLLYRPQKRLHPYQSLFSDIGIYFLTANKKEKGKRMVEVKESTTNLKPELYHLEENVKSFTSDYTLNNLKSIEPYLQQSYFEKGEGWSGKILTIDSSGLFKQKLEGRVFINEPIQLEGMINGRNNSFHDVTVAVETQSVYKTLANLKFNGFIDQSFNATISEENISNDHFSLRLSADKTNTSDWFSLTYYKTIFPQHYDMFGYAAKTFFLLPNSKGKSLLEIKNTYETALVYDITDKLACRFIASEVKDNVASLVVTNTEQKKKIYLTSLMLKPLKMEQVSFQVITPKSFDYLIITHASLRSSALEYAKYRASAAGGSFKPYIVEADSIINQFNFGERSPLAIRRFSDFVTSQNNIKNLLLIGRAYSYPYEIKTTKLDLVPTLGYPGSDILLTSGLAGFSENTPSIPTGRINATTNEQVLMYLKKVKDFEAQENGIWRKNIIHISGGKTKVEAQDLKEILKDLAKIGTNGILGNKFNSFNKTNDEEVEKINIAPLVNDGVGLITFFGHAGPTVLDMNFGFVSDPKNGFDNKKTYPLMIFNGCGVGEIFSRFNSITTDWAMTPEKGAILVLAQSYFGYSPPMTKYLNKLYEKLLDDPNTLNMSFGKVQQQVNADLDKEGLSDYEVSTVLQMLLQGDPAVKIYPYSEADYSIQQKGIYLQSVNKGSSIKNTDSVKVQVLVNNIGKYVKDQVVNLTLEKFSSTKVSSSTNLKFNSFRYSDTLTFTIVKDLNLNRIELRIDAENEIVELSKKNNTASLEIDWKEAQNNNTYPANVLPDLVAPTTEVFIDGKFKENATLIGGKSLLQVFLTDENELPVNNFSLVKAYIKSCENCDFIELLDFKVLRVNENRLLFSVRMDLVGGKSYQLVVIGKDLAGNSTEAYKVDLVILELDEDINVRSFPNPSNNYTKFDLYLPLLILPNYAELVIFNVLGEEVYNNSLAIATGKNEYFWQAPLAGMYYYEIILKWQDNKIKKFSGKIVSQN